MSSWFSSRNDKIEVTATRQGLFGSYTVRKTVTGRQAAGREADRLRRRGATDVRQGRSGWWAL